MRCWNVSPLNNSTGSRLAWATAAAVTMLVQPGPTDDVATMSTGTGRYRQVVVVPKGAPEFDEAQRSSQEAANNES